jgi:cyclohexyl-isocyanide hydratase
MIAKKNMNKRLTIGMLIFNHVTALDFFGPYEVFSRLPKAKVLIIGAELTPIRSETGVRILPDISFKDAPQLDLIFVPGGSGVNQILLDLKFLHFIRTQSKSAKYFASVCTGALILGACGLLTGYKATTHWASMDFLKELGAIPAKERFVIDRNRFTGGGVTAGIDLALRIVRELYGSEEAQTIQLMLGYDPMPEFKNAGSVDTADSKIIQRVRKEIKPMIEERTKAVLTAKEALKSLKSIPPKDLSH